MFVQAWTFVIYGVYLLLALAGLIAVLVGVVLLRHRRRSAGIVFVLVGAVLLLIPVALIVQAELTAGDWDDTRVTPRPVPASVRALGPGR